MLRGAGSGVALSAHAELRRARSRHRRVSFLDVAATLVGLAIVGVLAASAVESSSGRVGSAVVAPWLSATVAGAVVLLLVLAGIGSGSRGGPIPLEAPTVFLVLMAPVDRGAVLRQRARRQVFAGAVAGAAIAVVAAMVAVAWLPELRLVSWAVAGGLGGALAVGVSLLAAGARLRPAVWLAAQLLVGLWWLVDVALGVASSPVAALAEVPFRPLSVGGLAYPAVAALLAVGAGVMRVGHVSLERAAQRSRSAGQLRVAVGLNDFRTALLILRRRSHEHPRSRPWVGLPPLGGPVLRRGAHAMLRWPARRILRFVLLALTLGLVAPVAPTSPPVWAVVVVLLYLGGLDAIDAMAEELDHPDLLRLYPVRRGAVLVRHLPLPVVVLVGVNAVAAVVAGGVTSRSVVLLIGCGLAVPAAVAAVAGATLTASRVARPLTRYADIGLPVEAVAPRIILRLASPLLPIAGTVIPPVAGFAEGASPGTALLAAIPGLVASVVTIAWSTQRADR